MRNLLVLFGCVIFLAACAGVGAINKNYSKINYDDGVNEVEAKIIAKKCLVESDSRGAYQFANPWLLKDYRTFRHPGFWFVTFSPKNTLATDQYLVVIDKKNGDIRYCERNEPYGAGELDWVLNLEPKKYDWETKCIAEQPAPESPQAAEEQAK